MRTLTFNLDMLEEHYSIPRGTFHFLNTVIDNEISNDLAPDWDYQKGKLISCGMLHRDGVEIFIAESDDDNNFKVVVAERLMQLSERGYLFSFNSNMEQGNFIGNFDMTIPVHEIKPFKAKGWTMERFFKALIEDKLIPEVKIFDPLNGDEKKVIQEWRQYLNDKDSNHLMRIGFHNLSNLLKEVCVLRFRNHFLEMYDIDKGGFMLRKKG